ncbi:MAG: endonuclease/exonuclease/phosphatase family protein [Lentimicrobium sp.]|nr:endonuclease/exonuclease/phosphatase family protein [Lentimicrobium sp.]
MIKYKTAGIAGLMLIICILSNLVQAQHTSRIKIMTWNIRLDTPDDGLNQWKFRKENLCSEINVQSPTVLGVQEAMHNQMKDMRRKLKGYRSLGVARDDGKKSGEYSAIFYKCSQLKPLQSGTFWLSETPDIKGSQGWDAACNRVVTWAKFRERQTGKQFFVFNTHFDHKGDTARVLSAKLIIDKAASMTGKLPVILTGDMNVTEKHRAYRILTWAENEVVLSDTRKRAGTQVSGPEFSYIGFDPEFHPTELIDFIFATWDIRVISSHIFDFRQNLPWLSDHLPVIAELELP